LKYSLIDMKSRGNAPSFIWAEQIRFTPLYLLWIFAIPFFSLAMFFVLNEGEKLFWSLVILVLSAIAYVSHMKIQSGMTKVADDGIYGKFVRPTEFGMIDAAKKIFEPKYFALNFKDMGKILRFHEIDDVEPRANFCSWRVDILEKNGKIIYLYLSDLQGFRSAIAKTGFNTRGVKVEKFNWKNR
jgi:hypothetical protein